VEENVIESHISKLRKKLRARLGHDPIDSQRFLGYLLVSPSAEDTERDDMRAAG
jgi:DNA-binding response OmpR family regulator